MSCLGKAAMYCREGMGRSETVLSRLVEGCQVKGILLDTRCSRKLVWQDLVPMEKRMGGRVSIRCAHEDAVSYALANVSMEIVGQSIELQVGVAQSLPVPVLLGTDTPKLLMLLQSQGDG